MLPYVFRFVGNRRADHFINLRLLVCAIVAAIVLAAPARADLILGDLSVFPPVSGEYTWSYIVKMGPSTSLNAAPTFAGDIADMLEILDFQGYVPNSLAWTPAMGGGALAFATNDTLFTDPDVAFVAPVASGLDSPLGRNMKMVYTGTGFSNTTSNTLTLGFLNARLTVGTQLDGFGVSSITGPGGFATHTFSGAKVPQAPDQNIALPEPASLGLLMFAAMGLRRQRTR